MKLVQGQLRNRQENAEKLKNLETTLPNKLKMCKEQTAHMKKEIIKFDNVDQIVEEMSERRHNLSRRTEQLLNEAEKLKNKKRELQNKFNEKKKGLSKLEAFSEFSDLERKLGQKMQVVHNMKNFVNEKNQEMDISGIVKSCGALSEEINDLLGE